MPDSPQLTIKKHPVALTGKIYLILVHHRVAQIEFDAMPGDSMFTMYVPLSRFKETPKEGQRVTVQIQVEG